MHRHDRAGLPGKHVFQLAQLFNTFYHRHPILSEARREAEAILAGHGRSRTPRIDSVLWRSWASRCRPSCRMRASAARASRTALHLCTSLPIHPRPAHSWPRRIVLGLLVFVLVVACAGAIYENISEARDRRLNPMTGRPLRCGRIQDAHRLRGRGKSHGHSRVWIGRHLHFMAKGATAGRKNHARMLLRPRRNRL